MVEHERRQRVISSTPRLTPEDIANRSFGTGFRGYAEGEVRSFLRRVSEEVAHLREREQQLTAAVDDLEERLRAPRPLDEQELLEALGEETARLLRSAREAADDIRKKAEERAARVIEEAQEEARRLRTEAAEILGVRTQEAEAHAAGIVADAQARASEIRSASERSAEEGRQRAEQEAEAIVEAARRQGREMLDEARAARERVLADLGRRRQLLQAQVEELRQGRDRLLDAYRVVKRTFLDATEALSQVEARAATGRVPIGPEAGELPAAPGETGPEPVPTGTAAEAEAAATGVAGEVPAGAAAEETPAAGGEAEVAGGGPAGDAGEAAAGEDVPDAPGGAAPGGAAPGGEPAAAGEARALTDVDSLFARLRAGHAEGPPLAEPPGVPTEISLPEEESEADAPAADAPAPADGAAAWRERYGGATDPLLAPLARAAKRAAQDDQNALLDAVRRHKGRPTAQQVLGDPAAARDGWKRVLRAALDEAYGAGREAGGGAREAAPDDVLGDAADALVQPLRERLAEAIDDGDDADTSGIVERIGARYREWKNQRLERVLGDLLVAAWSRGVYDAAPEGAVLHWVPLTEGRCADCDDNALEPSVKGAPFPTGQEHPPAHPGCRCLLAPASMLEAVAAGPTPS
ncbi:MAG: hypothetical protein KatS3mg009_3385 [Acidimicrobiia bacterium]|nr:MAG: hypothetical protein KatS3mg009_3385 [Acidimicrobiia bacterium]